MTSQTRPPLLDQLVQSTLDRARANNIPIEAAVPTSAEARALVAYVTTRFATVHELVTAFGPRLSLLIDDDTAQVFASQPSEEAERELLLLIHLLTEATCGRFPVEEVRFTEVHSTMPPPSELHEPPLPRRRRTVTFLAATLELPLGLAALSATATGRAVPAQTLAERVRKILARQIGSGETTTLSHVAGELGMSRRALQRGLQGGYRYQQLAAQVFGERAALLLRNRPDLSVKEVASMLGFSGTRAFTRAFKRWFSQVPSEARSSPPDSRVVRRVEGAPDEPELGATIAAK